MVLNCVITLCRVTRASKLFQRNFYLPLLRPLSPKDAMRRHAISGKNMLGQRIEHYIPVLEDHLARMQRRKYMVKGQGKKRQRKKPNKRYLTPILDEEMENHSRLQGMLSRKPKGKGQFYTYEVFDKQCTLVFPYNIERAIRDKDIIDVIIAQRSEKIVLKLKNGIKVTMLLAPFDERAPLYRGDGWTKQDMEEYHHHGKETMTMARLFEAKEQGLEEWELEMIRMSNKRKRKHKAEASPDWKTMMAAAAENMDWDQFEEESKQIVEESNEPVDDEPIPMEVTDMEKTCNVNEKLKEAGEDVLALLPLMAEIPEILQIMQEEGEMTEMAGVSGAELTLCTSGKEVFVPGQMVTTDGEAVFVPGQTVEDEDGNMEYTPGITVLMDGEPTLLPGLVMGNEPDKAMFLPGESTITESGELQFIETEDDFVRESTPPPEPPEEPELEVEQDTDDEEEEAAIMAQPIIKPEKKEFVYERPKRIDKGQGVKRRERRPRGPLILPSAPVDAEPPVVTQIDPVFFDMTLPTFEKDVLEQEKMRVEVFTEKKAKLEVAIDKRRREIKLKAKKVIDSKPPPPEYQPADPVEKSQKLRDLEDSIKKGDFFDVDHRKFLCNLSGRNKPRLNWKDPYDFRCTIESAGYTRPRLWKSVH